MLDEKDELLVLNHLSRHVSRGHIWLDPQSFNYRRNDGERTLPMSIFVAAFWKTIIEQAFHWTINRNWESVIAAGTLASQCNPTTPHI